MFEIHAGSWEAVICSKSAVGCTFEGIGVYVTPMLSTESLYISRCADSLRDSTELLQTHCHASDLR